MRITIDGKSIVNPSDDGYLRNTLYTSYPTARYWFSITSESPPVYNRAILSALFLTFVQRVSTAFSKVNSTKHELNGV